MTRSALVILNRLVLLLVVVLMLMAPLISDAFAKGLEANTGLQVKDAFQPERPRSMTMSAGYLKIQNTSNNDMYIAEASSPEYQSVSIHRSFQVDGMHKMESVSPLKIAAGERVNFEPGGLHLMLHGPLVTRRAGDVTTIQFVTCDGETVSFEMAVVRP